MGPWVLYSFLSDLLCQIGGWQPATQKTNTHLSYILNDKAIIDESADIYYNEIGYLFVLRYISYFFLLNVLESCRIAVYYLISCTQEHNCAFIDWYQPVKQDIFITRGRL